MKELTSKLTAMKEMLYTETQTLEHKKSELSKKKVYLVSMIYLNLFLVWIFYYYRVL